MSTDLVPVSTFDLVPAAAGLAEQIARTDFAPQGLRGKPEAVMAAMLQGHELGIGPMASLAEIAVINGRPCMSAKLMRALVQRAGHDVWFHSKSNTKVVMRARRAEWPEDRTAEVVWTMDDAKAAGLAGGQNYRKYPRQMLAARCTGEICRDNFADVLGGIGYTPEELTDGDLVAEGDLPVDSRDDVATETSSTTRRAARPATAKKAPAKKAAPAARPAPAAVPVPPLPGEEGFDEPLAPTPTPAAEDPDEDIVDAEVVDDEPPATLLEAAKAAGFTQAQVLRRARGIAEEQGSTLPSGLDEVTGPLLAAVVADMGLAMPAGEGGSDRWAARNRKAQAMAAEAWPDSDNAERTLRRKGLVKLASGGRTDTSKDLTDDEWTEFFDSMDLLVGGSMVLHLRSNGAYELRRAPGGAS